MSVHTETAGAPLKLLSVTFRKQTTVGLVMRSHANESHQHDGLETCGQDPIDGLRQR
jgi:hypothetical protein